MSQKINLPEFLILIFYLIFRLYLKADKQQKEITKLVRHLALNEREEDNE